MPHDKVRIVLSRRQFVLATPAVLLAQGSRLTKVRDLEIYSHPDYYCGPGPAVIVQPNSRREAEILLAFRRSIGSGHAHPDVEVCLTRSADLGASWSEPQVFEYGPVTNPNLTSLPGGTILFNTHALELITPRTYERLARDPANARLLRVFGQDPKAGLYGIFAGALVRHSKDGGRTWGARIPVSPVMGEESPLPGRPSPVAVRNPAFVLKDGSLVLPVYTVRQPETAYLMESPDGGFTWRTRGVIARPAQGVGFNETVIHECPSGRIVAFMRPSETEMFVYTAESEDGGRTWTAPHKRTVWGFPCAVVSMPSGNVLLTYGYRRPPFGVRARLLDPECRRIDEAAEFVIREDGGERDLGYPAAAVLPDGTVMVAYYFNKNADSTKRRHIAASILREA